MNVFVSEVNPSYVFRQSRHLLLLENFEDRGAGNAAVEHRHTPLGICVDFLNERLPEDDGVAPVPVAHPKKLPEDPQEDE